MRRWSLKSLFIFMTTTACISSGSSKTIPTVIQTKTVVPVKSEPSLQDGFRYSIPPEILGISVIIRPHAELRDGPGLKYTLADQIIPHGRRVLVFSEIGIWRKVVDLKTDAKGWVHYKTLGKPEKSDKLVTIEASTLPKVFAVLDIQTAYSFGNMKTLKVSFEKGTSFYKLKETKNKVLVVLRETNSIIWLAKKDAQ